MSERKRGIPEEDAVFVPKDGPYTGFGSKSLVVPERADRQTPPITEAEPCQEDFNLAPWQLSSEWTELLEWTELPEPPEAAEKGA